LEKRRERSREGRPSTHYTMPEGDKGWRSDSGLCLAGYLCALVLMGTAGFLR